MIPYEDGDVDLVRCNECELWDPRPEKNRCTRFIYKDKLLMPYIPWFCCDECKGYNNIVCADFRPKSCCVDLCKRWTTFEEYYAQVKWHYDYFRQIGVAVWINGNKDTTYHMPQDQFVFGPMLDADGIFHYQKAVFSATRQKTRTWGPGTIPLREPALRATNNNDEGGPNETDSLP